LDWLKALTISVKPGEKRRPLREDLDATQAKLLTSKFRENAAQLRANPERAARARKCMRQETAIEPSTRSTPEFSKIEGPEHLR